MNVLLSAKGAAAFDDMKAYVTWVRAAQGKKDPNGIDTLGEPKFYTSGDVYDKPWGRPQNDGPALRAIALINFAAAYNNETYTRETLYSTSLNGTDMGPIKRDLEYVSHHWTDKSFDLWEEVKGHHFFTLMVQRKALILGADLARDLNDTGAATFYNSQVDGISKMIRTFWDGSSMVKTTFDCEAGCENLDGKENNLDSAQHLGALYGGTEGFFSATSDEILSTVEQMQQVMKDSYGINGEDSKKGFSGTTIGRYYPDHYTGTSTDASFKGQPWFLTSAALAEVYYRTAGMVQDAGAVKVNQVTQAFYERVGIQGDTNNSDAFDKLVAYGDGIMKRLRYHIGCDAGYFHVGEQFDAEYGTQKGANDLTWSYGTLISAMGARDAIH